MVRRNLKIMAFVLFASLALSAIVLPGSSLEAAKKPAISKTSLTLKSGSSKTLKIKNINKSQKVKWKSDTKTVAAVNKKGKVTAKKAGTATITAKVGKQTFTCKVTVKESSADDSGKNDDGKKDDSDKDNNTDPSADEAALTALIKELNGAGAKTSEDIKNKQQYKWDKNGNLTEINWSSVGLKGEVSFSGFKNLTSISCDSNAITKLDISGNTALTELYCNENNLSDLDVSNNTALKELDCSSNSLLKLDVSNNTALTSLTCGSNLLTELDLSNNTALNELSCENNILSKLNLSNNTALTSLSCGSNKLTELDLSANTALEELDCTDNNISELDLSHNTLLKELSCSDNNLTSIDLTNNKYLDEEEIDVDDDIDIIK